MGVLDLLRPRRAPTAPATVAPAPKHRALNSRDGAPYDAAALSHQDLGDWFPWLGSPDLEINPYRDRIVARLRDVVRNDGWASGAVSSLLDQVVGGDLHLVPAPDWQFLALHAPGFDEKWAEEFASTAEALWRDWGNNIGCWCDAQRALSIGQIFRLAFRHKLVDGDALAQVVWDRKRRGISGTATCVQLIDPDRLSNPQQVFDLRFMRGGVEIDASGAAIAYHIRRAHMMDWFAGADTWAWDRVPRETADGRPVIVHDFDRERAGQHRGAGGMFTPVLARMKMLTKYEQVELQAAVVNAIFAAYVESPYDPQDVQNALDIGGSGGDPRMAELSMYQKLRAWWHGERPITLGGVRIPTLMAGEKISAVQGTRPGNAFEAFELAMLRNIAAATGQSAEQVTRDYTRTNYSAARAGLMDAWKMVSRRRHEFGANFCRPVYSAVLEEWMDLGLLPLPAGAPDFTEARTAYSGCSWRGPGRGWIDPIKEAQAALLRMDAGISTFQQECAEQGQDWRKVVADRAVAIAEFKKRGLQLPAWAHDVPANLTETKPQPQ